MFLIRFSEYDFDLLATKDLFFTRDRKEAEITVERLNAQLQNIMGKCRLQSITGCVEIPELEVMIISTRSSVVIEMIMIDRLIDIDQLTFKPLL